MVVFEIFPWRPLREIPTVMVISTRLADCFDHLHILSFEFVLEFDAWNLVLHLSLSQNSAGS